ncbi:MAG: VOC family protein [Daejeonella sp.]
MILKGLRTIVYHVNDLEQAKTWYAEAFGIKPYFDEPFYVGFDINGSELGLDPSGEFYSQGNHSITYWKTDDIDNAFEQFNMKGIEIHEEIHNVGGEIRVGSIADPFGNVIGLIEGA